MANPQIEIEQLHQAIIDSIKDAFPEFAIVDDHARTKRIKTPALFLELSEMDKAGETGTDQLRVSLEWEAYILLKFNDENAARRLRKLAGALSLFVHHNQFKMPVTPSNFNGGQSEELTNDRDAFKAWSVRFSHDALLGEDIWKDEGETPQNPVVSHSPLIGSGNEKYYTPVDTAPETK